MLQVLGHKYQLLSHHWDCWSPLLWNPQVSQLKKKIQKRLKAWATPNALCGAVYQNWIAAGHCHTAKDSSGSRGGALGVRPPSPKISSNSCSFQAILREESQFWAHFGLRVPLGVKAPLGLNQWGAKRWVWLISIATTGKNTFTALIHESSKSIVCLMSSSWGRR